MAGNFKASEKLRAPIQTHIMKPDFTISGDNCDQIMLDFDWIQFYIAGNFRASEKLGALLELCHETRPYHFWG